MSKRAVIDQLKRWRMSAADSSEGFILVTVEQMDTLLALEKLPKEVRV